MLGNRYDARGIEIGATNDSNGQSRPISKESTASIHMRTNSSQASMASMSGAGGVPKSTSWEGMHDTLKNAALEAAGAELGLTSLPEPDSFGKTATFLPPLHGEGKSSGNSPSKVCTTVSSKAGKVAAAHCENVLPAQKRSQWKVKRHGLPISKSEMDANWDQLC